MLIGVYGLGRFGYYWADQLSQKFNVVAWSRNPKRHTPPRVKKVDEESVLSADVLILCISISSMEDVLKRISPKLQVGTLVMDTCSVKVYPAQSMMSILPETVSILATHPMFGPDSGRSGLEGLPIVLSPLRIQPVLLDLWHRHFSSLGLKVIEMPPDEHDREAAYTQGITHVIGRILGKLELSSSPIGTEGYKNLLDIIAQTCNDSWELFVDLQHHNQYTAQMRKELQVAIDEVMSQFNSI